MDDVSIDWLLKVAKSASIQDVSDTFASKLEHKQLSLNDLEELAQDIYVSLTKANKKPDDDPRLESVDLSIFTNFLIAAICQKKGYKMKNLKDCANTLNLTIFRFKYIEVRAQERLAKCLLDAANQIRS